MADRRASGSARESGALARWGGRTAVILISAFLLLPLITVVISSFSAANSFHFPPQGWSLHWYHEVFVAEDWMQALGFSTELIVLVVPVVLVLGVLGGYAVGAGRFPGRNLLSTLFLSPMAVPGVMLGLALLYQLQTVHLVGSVTGMWLAHLVVTFPFCVRVVAVSAAEIDPQLIRAARSLGASPVRAFLTVTVPLLRPGIVAGAFLTAVISLGEVAVSVFVAGTSTVTVPVLIYSAAKVQIEPTISAVSTLLLVASVVVIAVIDRVFHLSRLL